VKTLRLLVVLSLLTGCAGHGGPQASRTPTPATTAPTMPAYLRVIQPSPTGRNGEGRAILVITERGDRTSITSRLGGGKVTIIGQGGRYTRDGRVVAVVAASADGFRLTNASGRTLWRVRITPTRVQVRRGEKTARYEFRTLAGGRIRVQTGGRGIGDVRAVEQGTLLTDAAGMTLGLSSSPPSASAAALLCLDVPPDLRAVLGAAFLARN
jgi:hypothetical protein